MSLLYTRPDRYLHLGVFPSPKLKRAVIGGAPDFMKPLRALFLSDIHLRPDVDSDRLNALLDCIDAQKADLILMGGDYAESAEQCLRFFEAFVRIRPRLGAYAVPGNNDLDSMPGLRETMAASGVTLLCNEYTILSLDGGTLEIGGCDDHEFGSPRTDHLFSGNRAAYRILISHFPKQPDCRCDLLLSGHTHAGQFNLLGITPYSVMFERRHHLLGVRGLLHKNNMRLLIGNGIGVSRIPMRIGAEPQIYLLEFGKEDFL